MILESNEATKKYGGKTAVDHVSLKLESGLVYAMLGPNGSGKTTWMKMVAGLVKPTSAEHFAKQDNCLGLITGESIGQVASQTLQSLAATNEVCTLPVYRPVIGFDKQEIVERSWEIGTYDTSVLPYEDCCTIFVAKHPVTKPNLKVIQKSEEKLAGKIDELMEEALRTTEVLEIQ